MVNNYVRNCMENGFVYGVTLNRVERMDLAMSLNWMARLSQRFFMGIARDLGSFLSFRHRTINLNHEVVKHYLAAGVVTGEVELRYL
eukprot:scaffold177065_cov66-Cyclotella_meneghiniana.AAC.3